MEVTDLINRPLKRILCPYCGCYHEPKKQKDPIFLTDFDEENVATMYCKNIDKSCRDRYPYQFYVVKDENDSYFLFYRIKGFCSLRKGFTRVSELSTFSTMKHNEVGKEVTNRLELTSVESEYDSYSFHKCLPICENCNVIKNCSMYQYIRENPSRINYFSSVGFEFEKQEEIIEDDFKEDNTMANLLGINLEFGANNDENIASTVLGVAVKVSDSSGEHWRIYDKDKGQITDLGKLKLGNLPIWILPTTKLEEGDLVKDSGEYYYVQKVQSGSTQTLCARTGELKEVIPIKNILGISVYSKIVAIGDAFKADSDIDKVAIVAAACSMNNGENQMSQILPMLLLGDSFKGAGDDITKVLLLSGFMGGNVGASDVNSDQMNQMLPLLLLKDKLPFNNVEGDDDILKMILLLTASSNSKDNAGMNQMLPLMLLKDRLSGNNDSGSKINNEGTVPFGENVEE